MEIQKYTPEELTKKVIKKYLTNIKIGCKRISKSFNNFIIVHYWWTKKRSYIKFDFNSKLLKYNLLIIIDFSL